MGKLCYFTKLQKRTLFTTFPSIHYVYKWADFSYSENKGTSRQDNNQIQHSSRKYWCALKNLSKEYQPFNAILTRIVSQFTIVFQDLNPFIWKFPF
jgi:hypothetical protein